MVQETKVEEYEMYGYPKPVSLDEALRRPRGGGRPEFPETDVDEVADSDAIRWDERQNLLASSRSEGSFRSSKRFRTNDDREWLGGRREVGPRDVESAYFHNLIDRWKKLSLFGEDEIDRGSAALEGEVPKQCWRPPDAMGESDNWIVPEQDFRHLADRWKRQEER